MKKTILVRFNEDELQQSIRCLEDELHITNQVDKKSENLILRLKRIQLKLQREQTDDDD